MQVNFIKIKERNRVMKNVIFAVILVMFLPMFLKAQDNAKNEINNFSDKSIYSLQELNSKLVDSYGADTKFMKLENGQYSPINKVDIKKISETQISSDVILVFAIIGAVLVGLILLRSL